MKVFQCIHKYAPHIKDFEEKYNIKNQNLSFNEIRELLIKDGYASTYILKPALDGETDKVFFTIWDYHHLQFKWAEENNLKTKNLDEIKLAQIDNFKPDVFYNQSPNYDNNFIDKIKSLSNIKTICWDGIIKKYPTMHLEYDARVTLFEPYVKYWNKKGLKAFLLTPAYVPSWEKYKSEDKDIDVLFYGQYNVNYFSNRNKIIKELLEWQKDKKFNVDVHLQGAHKKAPLINVKGIRRITQWINKSPKVIRKYAKGPIYGDVLYKKIGRSKIVVNAFTNNNGLYKDNMRNYEAIGMQALLIGEDGIYPDFIENDQDILTYKNTEELIYLIEDVLSQPKNYRQMAEKAHLKMKEDCSKEIQWNQFCDIVDSI